MSSSLSASRPPRRTALLVGINYNNNASATLNGCYNDVVNVSQYLRLNLGYATDAITLLTDGNRSTITAGAATASALPPTRQNILAGMAVLVAGMVAGDEAVFHFSGHGTLVRDTNGDEVTGLDSCLCPLDYNAPASAGGGIITDDELRALLVNKVPRGARLYVILDCCHNGTGCDVRYKYEDYSIRIFPTSGTPFWRTQQKAFANGKYTETAGEVFMISGSRDEQTSADAYINNSFSGALTYAVFAILRSNQATIRTYSWSSLLRDLRHFMSANKYSQIPQIMTGQLISPARAVFAVVAAASGARSALSVLELTTGSVGMGGTGARDVSASDAASTLFLFSVKPKSGSNKSRQGIQFLV